MDKRLRLFVSTSFLSVLPTHNSLNGQLNPLKGHHKGTPFRGGGKDGAKKKIINNQKRFNNFKSNNFKLKINNHKRFNLFKLNNLKLKINKNNKINNNLTLNFKNSLSPNYSTIRNSVNVRKQQILIHRFLKVMSIYNLDIQGTFLYFNRFIAFNFNFNRNKLIKEIYDILFFAFKSMSCLISKPVFSFKTDKIIIHLFYFLISPAFLKFKRPLRKQISKIKKINRNRYRNRHRQSLKKTSRRFKRYGERSIVKGSHPHNLKNLTLQRRKSKSKNFFRFKFLFNKFLSSSRSQKRRKAKFSRYINSKGINMLVLRKIKFINKNKKLHFNDFKELKRNKRIFRNYKSKKKFIKFYYNKLVNKPLTLIYPAKFKALCFILSKFFNKPVELNLIRVHYPYSNSNILVNFFALFVNKVKVIKVVQKLFNNAIFKNIVKNKFSSFNNKGKNTKDFILPAFLTGMNIKIAGRLLRDKIKPRKTIRFFNKGVYAHSKLNYKDFARFTTKNKRGIFSISINSSQSFFNKY